MVVRRANISDAPGIARIHVETWRAAYRGLMPDDVLKALSVERRAQFWREHLSQSPGTAFVAEAGGQVAGFCDLVPSRDEDAGPDAVAEIAAIYIDRQFWRQGAGRALCECALAEARRKGCTRVTLWVLAGNLPAKHFYAAMGFQPDGTSKMHQIGGAGLPHVRLSRPL